MSLLSSIKKLSITVGLYKPVRLLDRKLRSNQQQKFDEDCNFYRSFINKGDLCFDVGANIGQKSEALLSIGARVVAIEPNPKVLPELESRCSNHKNFNLVKTAIGSVASVATLYARNKHGMSGLSKEWEDDIVATFNVPVITLDAVIKHFGCPVFCKIDVEGWEVEVFRGLSSPIPLISFEFHLDRDNIIKTIECMSQLENIMNCEVNVISSESTEFIYSEWIPLKNFKQSFPSNVENHLTDSVYGDIFVRNIK